MAAKVFKNFIGGEWVESRTGQTYENLNPADTRDVIGIFQRSDKRDVDDAVSAAKQAFERWRLFPAPKRAEIIYRAGEILLERKEEYARLNDPRDGQGAERNAWRRAGSHGHGLLHGRRGPAAVRRDRAVRIAEQVRHGGAHAYWRVRHDRAVEFPHGDPFMEAAACAGLRQHLRDQARGRYSAFNAQPAQSAHGCRAAERRSQRGDRIWRRSRRADCRAPDVHAISFTGSSEVGRIVGETAARSFKPCSLEMGGKNAIIILDDANLDLALEGALWGAFGTTGQRCTAASRVIVQKGVYTPVCRQVDLSRAAAQSGQRPG